MRLFLLVFLIVSSSCSSPSRVQKIGAVKQFYRSAQVNGHKMFYREAGDPKLTTIVLLHGYPSSSHTYRDLIPLLASSYHVIAPDNLGSGFSDHPHPDSFNYTFDKLADQIESLLSEIGVNKYVLYMQDFGAPVGFRLMVRKPENLKAIISQNANAYLDGLTEKRQLFFKSAHQDKSKKQVSSLFSLTSKEAIIQGQYLRDVPMERRGEISPDSWTHDLSFLQTTTDRKIQVQLFQDYQNNIDQYPFWQSIMRRHQFPALIAWGKNDQAFIHPGASAFLRDLPKAKLVLLDAGHFAVEERHTEIAKLITDFLNDNKL